MNRSKGDPGSGCVEGVPCGIETDHGFIRDSGTQIITREGHGGLKEGFGGLR